METVATLIEWPSSPLRIPVPTRTSTVLNTFSGLSISFSLEIAVSLALLVSTSIADFDLKNSK